MVSGAAGAPRRPLPDFLVAPYVPDLNGVLQPLLPSCCPRCSDAAPCRLSIHVRRQRAQGPAWPLAVVRCATHGGFFTAYPPGWLPYKRLPVLHVGLRGERLESSTPDADPTAGTLLELPSLPNQSRRTSDTDTEHQAARRRSEARARARQVALLERWSGLSALTGIRERVGDLLRLPLAFWGLVAVLETGCRLAVRWARIRTLWQSVLWGPDSLWRWMAVGELTGVIGKAWIAWPVQGGVTLLAGAASVPFQNSE